jgi:serine/threonine-protein kinase 24/25/MST4
MSHLEWIDPRYKIEALIGRGAFGRVYYAYDAVDDQHVAVKLINLEDVSDELGKIQIELDMMSSYSNCPSLVHYMGSFIKNGELGIVMEFMDAGSLVDNLAENSFDEESISFVLARLLSALVHLHSCRKLHRDVKAANILVSSRGLIKLADFGAAGKLSDSMGKRRTRAGTPFWMAPEVIMESSYDGCADVWSVGITAIELAHGSPPLEGKVHPMQAIFLIPKSPPPTLNDREGVSYTSEFKKFVEVCLQKEPMTRPSTLELSEHAFISLAPATAPETFLDIVKETASKKERLRRESAPSMNFEVKANVDFFQPSGNFKTHAPSLQNTGLLELTSISDNAGDIRSRDLSPLFRNVISPALDMMAEGSEDSQPEVDKWSISLRESLTGLDLTSDGKSTTDFATALVSLMMQELESES